MKILRVYVDSSVIGGCLDEEFAGDSRALLEMARRSQVLLLLSDLLVSEIELAPRAVLEVLRGLPAECIEEVRTDEEAEALRDEYLAAQVAGQASRDDALHVAIATVNRADVIVSWNFKHIVHYEKIRGFNAVNLRLGYAPLAIHSPREVV